MENGRVEIGGFIQSAFRYIIQLILGNYIIHSGWPQMKATRFKGGHLLFYIAPLLQLQFFSVSAQEKRILWCWESFQQLVLNVR